MKTEINQLFNNIHSLPQVPDVVSELITQLGNPNINMSEIAKNVELEPSISLKILRLVNSAHFSLSRKVGSITEALSFLGMDQLKTLIIGSGFTSAVPAIEGFDIEAFWNKTFLKAMYAKALADTLKHDGTVAFTAAIISNIGTVLIQLGDSKAALEIDQHVKAHPDVTDQHRYTYEKRRLGYISTEVAAELSTRWKFSEELVSAIADSAEPLTIESPSKLACIVHIAEYISSHKKNSTAEEIIEHLPLELADKLNITKAVLIEETASLLELESPAFA